MYHKLASAGAGSVEARSSLGIFATTATVRVAGATPWQTYVPPRMSAIEAEGFDVHLKSWTVKVTVWSVSHVTRPFTPTVV